jgi:hypothetical protein
MHGLLPAPVTKLLVFDLALYLLLVFIGVIITPLADGTAHRYQPVGSFHFSHSDRVLRFFRKGNALKL